MSDAAGPEAAGPEPRSPDLRSPDLRSRDLRSPDLRSPDLRSPGELTFEQLMTALESVTDRLASGEIGIEAAADLYEQAERLHDLAGQRLAQVQERVDRLGSRDRLEPGGSGFTSG